MTICIQATNAAYAVKELTFFLTTYAASELVPDSAEKTIRLSTDTSLAAHHYRLRGDGRVLEIVGGSESALLCGVYEALSDAGILFTANGHSVPMAFSVDTLFSLQKEVCPKFRLRGIRQHINFPMDVSSYSLEEAKEYIRNSARMRYNAITFHTYPGQWHVSDPADPESFAGHFFYGKTYHVPEDALTASRIHNQKIYCIPEAEPFFADDARRSEYAVHWLQELMKTVKEAAMELTLSVEIVRDDEEVNARMLHALCKAYPLIDTLELITEENGGEINMPSLTADTIGAYLRSLFGEDISPDTAMLQGLTPKYVSRLGGCALSLSRALRMIEKREGWLQDLPHQPSLRCGIYVTNNDLLHILRPILRAKCSADMTMSLLPAHGSLAVAEHVASSATLAQDWQNTMFYSWAEFDGNMYLQQLGTDGIEMLTHLPAGDAPLGFCINHWRTAENTLCLSYAAQSAITPIKAVDFYAQYAQKTGLDAQQFARVCTRLAGLDTYCRDHLFNIGFCSVNNWLSWHRKGDKMLPRGFAAENLNYAIDEYTALAEMFSSLTAATKEGATLAALLSNRCETSVMFVRCIQTLDELSLIYDYEQNAPTSAAQKNACAAVIERAREYALAYLHLYGACLPDRGGEGQLVSFAETAPVYIDAIAESLLGKTFEITEDDFDAPPMPDPDAL